MGKRTGDESAFPAGLTARSGTPTRVAGLRNQTTDFLSEAIDTPADPGLVCCGQYAQQPWYSTPLEQAI